MTDVQNTPNAPATGDVAIATIKKQADRLGITYKSNTSIATLQKAIKEKLEGPIGEDSDSNDESESKGAISVGMVSGVKSEEQKLQEAYDKCMKLHRVIITPMEATKAANMESELFCAGNSVVGTVKRVITFGEPWHVEHILLSSIKEKQYQMFQTKKNAKGVTLTSAKLVPAYNITYLDPLTEEELDNLAEQQIRTRSLEDE